MATSSRSLAGVARIWAEAYGRVYEPSGIELFTLELPWSPWYPLEHIWDGLEIPASPGLYRIRHERGTIDYVGETGRDLRKRLVELRGVYQEQMPFRDPHTAAPALWAIRQQHECDYEVSFVPLKCDAWFRKGLEAREITLVRRKQRQSPTANFGRMPHGFSISTYQAGQVRGSKTRKRSYEHYVSEAPCSTSNASSVTDLDWCGHEWSPWRNRSLVLRELDAGTVGLYRLRIPRSLQLAYVGQGRIRTRLRTHSKKQAPFDEAELVSFCTGPWSELEFQRLELETELIGDHMLKLGAPPIAQFRGEKG